MIRPTVVEQNVRMKKIISGYAQDTKILKRAVAIMHNRLGDYERVSV